MATPPKPSPAGGALPGKRPVTAATDVKPEALARFARRVEAELRDLRRREQLRRAASKRQK